MCLVGVPPVNAPHLLESRPEPETLEAGPEQRVADEGEEYSPNLSPVCERRVSSHCRQNAGAHPKEYDRGRNN